MAPKCQQSLDLIESGIRHGVKLEIVFTISDFRYVIVGPREREISHPKEGGAADLDSGVVHQYANDT